MVNNKIRIKLQTMMERHSFIDDVARDIVLNLRRIGADLSGPIPLPLKIKKYTVNRSPHVDKKSREQYETRVKSRLIIIDNPNQEIINSLKNIDLPAGVDVQIN